ncbi:MAG TPA: ATP-binding protein [Thermoanaerobaculia bacterium]
MTYAVELQRLRLLLRRRVAWLRSVWDRDDRFQGAAIGDAEIDRLLAPDVDAEREFLANDPATGELAALVRVPTPLGDLARAFGLDELARDTMMLCLAAELDPSFELLFGYVHDDITRKYPTAQLAHTLFGGDVAAALSPLRRWALVHVDAPQQPATPLLLRPLRLDGRIAAHLLGIEQRDDTLAEVLRPLEVGPLCAEHARLAEQLAAHDAINLTGGTHCGKETLAHAIAAHWEHTIVKLDPRRLPPLGPERTSMLRALEREARLVRLAYFVQAPEREGSDINTEVAMQDVVDTLDARVVVDTRDPWPGTRTLSVARVLRPDRNAQRAMWREVLQGEEVVRGPLSVFRAAPGETVRHGKRTTENGQPDGTHRPDGTNRADGTDKVDRTEAGGPLTHQSHSSHRSYWSHQVDDLVEQFDFSPEMIARAARAEGGSNLWELCQQQVSWRIDDLAQRITTRQRWDDLVLDTDSTTQLHEIAAQVAQRARVYERWGFARWLARGRGITALFAGPSGTGKTMAAEILAGELGLELYRIDLAGVVSKYIGESEKNLRRVFDAAEQSGAILFFDEADALFGKRTEVKDSHDLYANIQVNYLLQRMEDYRGLAILATNRKTALDRAFLRRLRFVIDFPFPDREARDRIWRHAFPAEAPMATLDYTFLSRLEIAGGNIRNIALNAAFLAAADGSVIDERHVVHAVRREYAKMQKLITESEFGLRYREYA